MKKYFLLILLVTPSLLFAWNYNDSNEKILKEFNSYIQPKTSNYYKNGNIIAKYSADYSKLSDYIYLSLNGKKTKIKGPLSNLPESRKKEIINCYKTTKINTKTDEVMQCGVYIYSIVRLSPSGYYIELDGLGWESSDWKLINTSNGKTILSNDNGVIKSMWSKDRKRFIFQTSECEIGGCDDQKGTFITINGKFPNTLKIK